MAQAQAESPSGVAAPSLPATMRAWQYSGFGGGADALALATVPVPAPKPGHVLVRVAATSMNPLDYKLQHGEMRPLLPPQLPFTPGLEAAGKVVALPPGGSSLFSLGDQVFGSVAAPASAGAFAEFMLLPEAMAALRPPSVTPAQALALTVTGCAPLQALRDSGGLPLKEAIAARLEQKEAPAHAPLNVMVANASGGVGIVAVQLAKLSGEHVTATCGARNMEFVRGLGADEVLDYRTPEGKAFTSPSGRKHDVLLDGTPTGTWAQVGPALAPAGKWLHMSPSPAVFASAALNVFSRQKLLPVMSAPTTADLGTLAELLSKGLLKVDIDSEFPFAELPKAWQKCQSGQYRGKIVVTVP